MVDRRVRAGQRLLQRACTNVNAFYVGPEAESLWRSGARPAAGAVADYMPGTGMISTISIQPSGIMRCGCSLSDAATASFDSPCSTE